MAERTLTVKIIGDNRSLERALRSSTREIDTFGKRSSRAFSQFTKGAGLGVATAGFVTLGLAAKAGFKEMLEAAKVSAQTEAAIKSTGGVAGVTAQEIDNLSQALLRKTGIDDEAIKSSQNLLLTFTNIRNVAGEGNDIFNQASLAVLDMSTRMGTDATQAALQLGKALQDPIRGMTALRRSGVSFTQQQQDMIRNLVNTGRVMDAQKLILRELNVEFGGSAEAAGRADGGIAILRETITNFLGELVTEFMPTIEDATKRLQAWFDDPANKKRAIDTVSGAVEGLSGAFSGVAEAIDKSNKVLDSVQGATNKAGKAVNGFLRFIVKEPPEDVEKAAIRARDLLGKQLGLMVKDSAEAGAAAGLSFGAALEESFAFKGRPDRNLAEAPGMQQAVRQAGASAEMRNRWFDAIVGRRLNRTQDINNLQGQLRELDEIAALIQERIAKTKDVTRRLSLEDDLLDVRRRQRTIRGEIAANREAHAQEMQALKEQRQQLAQEAREREALARSTRQFRALGLGPGGAELIPNADSLRKRLGSVTQAVRGTMLDTSATRGMLARIRRVLVTGGFGKIADDVRATIDGMLDDITDSLKEFGKEGGPETRFRKTSSNALLAGLGLDPAELRALRARLSQVGVGGTVPTRQLAAFGMPAGGSQIAWSINLDGQPLEANVTRRQGTRKRRNPRQKRGVEAGL